jgi:hypothetical protein
MTGTSAGSSACFYEVRDIDGLGDNGVLILTLLLPWALMQLFGYIFLFAALFFVWQTGGFPAIVKQTRLLLFLAVFGSSLSLGLILPFELAIWGNGPATSYLTCEIQNWAAGLFLNSQEEKLLPHCSKHHIFADPFAYYYNAAIHTVTFGLLVFIFFFPDAWREARHGKNSTSPTLNSSKISGLSKGSKQSSTTISSHSQNSQST